MEITNNLLAAYAEGNVSKEEREAVRKYLTEHPEEMESIMIMMDNDYELGTDLPVSSDKPFDTLLSEMLEKVMEAEPDEASETMDCDILPMMEMAAQNTVDNQCVIRCEGLAMRHFGIDISDETIMERAREMGWLKAEGIALHLIGTLCGEKGLSISHQFGSKIKDIEAAILAGNIVIAAIDGNELTGNRAAERRKDKEIGSTPNHAVVVCSVTVKEVTITDPGSTQETDTYPLEQFIDAWADSSNYMTVISNGEEYDPHPIDLSDVEISDELLELREAIAEQAHEVWALNRKREGWTYGPVRDDEKKHNPDMVAYNRLPESEKHYDREMAIHTIKLVKKLGWDIIRKKK